MKKGFTLIEILAVVSLIAMISILTLPTIINQVNNKKEKLSDTMLDMMKSSTELYLDKYVNLYPRKNGDVYCIPLKSLVDDGFLSEPVKDIKTDKEIEVLTKVGDNYEAKTKMKVEVISPVDFNMTFIDENTGTKCTEVRK